ncbi:YbjQ family protein [Thermoflavimicrobium dichotomicum]|uniref:UPF0145 protein SAMN05421852_1014 n=1 Tax=Thermoflavimicrobium dichotomicum TaxID=46223 RepID=A0A1I3JBT3_9BACL|nr:YbjQ family protein [Thermoflavimicrobium dichotomicum]SFI57395.1 Uncharacterized conserved protein YbjQ, UPF0145 family [Thermoflavimicrobium dichotomicum]
MIITTTHYVQGKEIEDYLGIVSGEAIMGANIFRDILATITDVIGGRSGQFEGKFAEAKDVAIQVLTERAQKLGADAVIGVSLDFEAVRGEMLTCIATGTAVKLKS